MTSRSLSKHVIAGISLIEMMIALVIGLVLMLGVIQVFSASRTASMLAEGSARAQENGRFALEFLQRDIRMAGHFGCVNDQAHFVRGEGDPVVTTGAASGSGHPLDFSVSVQGYEAPNTKPLGSLTIGANWAVPANLPASISKLNPRGGSDILVLRYLAPESVPITALTSGSTSIVGFNAAAGLRLTEGGQTAPNLFGIADCAHATVFKGVYASGKVTANGTNLSNYSTRPSGQALIYRAESLVYYVGTSATSGEPSLMRARSNGIDDYGTPEELVEGIENMQLVFGLDQTSIMSNNSPPVGNINMQAVASDVSTGTDVTAAGQWRRVGQVQVGILARSPTPSTAERPVSAVRYPNALGVSFAPPTQADGRYRMTYESTIALRNRLFGN
ncbi:PilW family protein [Xanthomonas hortorum]|uniref:PilW family protein n=2 Tax=Xanthomonas hortorum TaxID=56454 RepID=A0A6V7DNJ5_9XANT|nr:PilW family protein [Xanthomonas hortorum]ASW45736.1 pilus assembly protein PilW [Xanthomonas hortorum]MCC8493100.1 PilW family protein [Xanthomonas hortorum pv. gardneri]MCE4280954.1 PilW family protein [Xanthomonas hortorum pv. vitians]MCE4286368.1 PilW family protein [Xanthomonas hortorum pv. vitians]MCE4290858.1 PilW family protein [Xanthomonas hortorum pv. vitians]